MSGSLNHILSMGNESLMNARVAVDVTGHNISNANVEGYSRQSARIGPRDPVRMGNHTFGQGATLQGVERIHDKFLEVQLTKELQSTTEKETTKSGLQRIENLFNPDLTSTVRDRMNSFFNAARELANYPEEPAVRTHLAEVANNLTATFNENHANIETVQKDINDQLTSEVELFNKRLEELAAVNQRVLEVSNGKESAGDLLDQRDKLVREITSTMDCTSYENSRGMMVIRGPGGGLLLEGPNHARLNVERAADDLHSTIWFRDIAQATTELTPKIKGGKIGALLQLRDGTAQDIRNELNTLAKGFADSVNAIHQQGYGGRGYDTKSGRDFFEGVDAGDGEPARSIQVASHIMADPYAIAAAMTPESAGDNGILIEMIKLQSSNTMDNGKTSFAGVYDRFVGKLGNEMMRSSEELNSSKVVLAQIKAQKEATSGVSLDEEASNLIKHQHLFAASSRVITTADELMKTILDLKR
jgi:flagellar hook-associated protein 1 FlgK